MAVWLLLYRADSGPGLFKTDIYSLTDVLRRGGGRGTGSGSGKLKATEIHI